MKKLKFIAVFVMLGVFILLPKVLIANNIIKSEKDDIKESQINDKLYEDNTQLKEDNKLETELKEVGFIEIPITLEEYKETKQSISKTINILPAASNMEDLKSQIEAATTDITINLDPGTYEFDSQITNILGIKVTLIGAVDVNGKPKTQFTMDSTVAGAPRFIRVDSGTLDISNVEVIGNKDKSGGISAKNVVAKNCMFSKNYTTDGVNGGGAIRSNGGTLSIEDSTFTENSVGITSDGGAVSSQYGGDVYINNSIFEENSRIGNNNQYGGAISIKQPSISNTKINITNSIFKNNTLTATGTMTKGGAIGIYSTPQVSSVLIDNVLFKGNKNTSRSGGAIAFNVMTTKSTVSNCTFIDNTAAYYGGAVYYENSTGDNKIINSTFVGNSAMLGGASIGAYASYTTLDSSSFISNPFATQGTGSLITVENSIVSGTSAYESATIKYQGINLARKTSGEPSIDSGTVFTAYTSNTLEKVSDQNYVAPIIINGPAYEKISTSRLLINAQNGIPRKTPLSDIGAFESLASFNMDFNINGGEGSSPDSQIINYGELATAPTDPIRTRYTFIGWNTTSDGSGETWDFGVSTMPANDVTLYAQWRVNSYELRFSLNGGEGSSPDSQIINYGELATAPTDPIRIGYTFIGWNTTSDGSGETWDFGVSTMPENDVTLYAQWRVNSYELRFNLNGGDPPTPEIQIINYGELAKRPVNPTKIGYTFIGWNTKLDGSGNTWSFLKNTMPANNVTLFAQWKVNSYELRFDLNGGNPPVPETQIVEFDKLAKEPSVPVKTGYTFVGWNTKQDGSGNTWDFSKNTMPANNITLYAQWKINSYELRFDLNGGNPPIPETQIIEFNKLAKAPTDPVKTGYTFVGWNTKLYGSGNTWDFAKDTMPANNVTLYAQWKVNSYELRFDLNGGNPPIPEIQIVEFDRLAKEPVVPMKTGYRFIGWNTKQDGSGNTWDFVKDTMPSNNVKLYAQWDKETNPDKSYGQNNKTLPRTGGSGDWIKLNSLMILVGEALLGIRRKRGKGF